MPFDRIARLLLKIFGSRNERLLKSYAILVEQANSFEPEISQLDDRALGAATERFRETLKSGADPALILPEAFAVVREAARRNVEMRHFDVQLIGGNVLYDGRIAEMATGEGKTLVATLAAYLVAISGRKVHIITVNDYLAKRDAEWMGPVYRALGLTVGAIQADMDTAGENRKEQYACDITYGTNNEFGFDYLRDNMKVSLEQMVQSPLDYAIIDEVDSILVDEARTPLIISGPAFDDVSRYKKADAVARKLIERQGNYDRTKSRIDSAKLAIAAGQGQLSQARKNKDTATIEKIQQVIDQKTSQMEQAAAELEKAVQYYEVERDRKQVHLTHEGISQAQEIAQVGSFYVGSNMEWPHLLEQSLRAHITFDNEKDYVVIDGQVVIVDEFTGRLMHGRQWSDGLHQAVEAKESVPIKEETQTLATITLQNFFKLYRQIAGMTGTAATEAEEFMKIYGLEVVTLPTNKPCIRQDTEDMIYKTMPEKYKAIADEIHHISRGGRPVLVGTISIEKSETLSRALSSGYGLDHEVLNAKQHEREAHIVAKAGHQHAGRDGRMWGNVTIATNMAGRGTDIKLGPGVADIGGLHILGTERHEARRIDNQLRGRCGRQGDAGSSQFFLSFDDDLMKVFAPDWTVKALSWIGWQEGEPIVHKRISKGIEKAQKKVEQRNYETRKSLLEYDEVMDYQRKIFYSRRRAVLAGKDLRQTIEEMIGRVVEKNCRSVFSPDYRLKCIVDWARNTFGVELRQSDISGAEPEQIEWLAKKQAADSAATEISLTLGEYLEDYEDPATWDTAGLAKWAAGAFGVNLRPAKISLMKPEEIEQQLVAAAAERIDKTDCSDLARFLRDDYTQRTFADWAATKFDIRLQPADLEGLSPAGVQDMVLEKTAEKYRQREIDYPVEYAMNLAYGNEAQNVYNYQAMADWVNRKYDAGLTVEHVSQATPSAIRRQLRQLSDQFNNGSLAAEIDQKTSTLDADGMAAWATARFGRDIDAAELGAPGQARERLLVEARKFFRQELADLEKYVLLQTFDSVWKDHLYAMDHLKDSIWTRSFAEKDPKIEYKREGFRMFNEMLDTIDDRVTDVVFKIRLEAGARARSVWRVSRTAHDQVSQFALGARRMSQAAAAAESSQGQGPVKPIKLDQPKVGRNDPCPCGSGRKYKKCCGAGG